MSNVCDIVERFLPLDEEQYVLDATADASLFQPSPTVGHKCSESLWKLMLV